MDAVLAEKEKRADLIREAVERELRRRERGVAAKRAKSTSYPQTTLKSQR